MKVLVVLNRREIYNNLLYGHFMSQMPDYEQRWYEFADKLDRYLGIKLGKANHEDHGSP